MPLNALQYLATWNMLPCILIRSHIFIGRTGKVFLQRSNSSDSPSDCRHQTNQTASKLQDLNSPPSPTLNLFDEVSLITIVKQLYRSVCTLDRVKSALERAEREQGRKRSASLRKSSICNSAVPMPILKKKPRIDLNISI
ncbi:hypothetical protein SADUNF_Sadunf07G0054200 [Salix dunnii]|uniref:Uncharacterized protein n=1 Tax=Salix dunnii TaxID=1413687 RepID=A0A835K060_9ROSI|nr:hypothetical protein SADUNF_Sadunf07G0054200 [Salix dunnii]